MKMKSATNPSSGSPQESSTLAQPVSESTSGSGFDVKSPELAETTVVQLTEYHDVAEASTVAAPGVTADSIWSGTNTLPDQTLKTVLSRSYQLGVYTWTTAAAGTDIISNLDVITTLLAIPNIAEKVAYFRYFRCKGVRLTIRINATPWHYGALVASSTVNNSQDFHSSTTAGTYQYMNNRPVVLDASSADAVDYEIGWKNKNQWITNSVHFCTFRLTVASPLSMIGTAVNNARVTVFASFIDPEVALPTADSITLQAQSRSMGREEAVKKSESNVVLSTVSSFADTVFDTFSTVSDVVSKLAPLAALVADKPSSLRGTEHVVVLPGTDLTHGHGIDTGVKLSLDPAASAGISTGVLGESMGNPTINQLVSMPGFLERFSFTTATAAGTMVWSHTLSLAGMSALSTAGAVTTITPTPLNWYAVLFKFWRGSLKFHIHFVASSFITARLRFVWIPAGCVAPATISDNESGDYVSQVVEVTGSMDHSFTIPWISRTLYNTVMDDYNMDEMFITGTTTVNSSLGTIAVYLVTPVISVDSTVVPTVSGLVWVAGGEDMQFSNFSGMLEVDANDTVTVAPAPALEAQCSIYNSFASEFAPIIAATTSLEAGIATSESYHDVVTLGKRYAQKSLGAQSVSSTVYTDAFTWDVNSLFTPASGMPAGSFHKWLTACHVNFRGSVRFKVFWSPQHEVNTTMPSVWGAWNEPTAGSSLSFSANPKFMTSSESNRFIEWEVPWNTRWPFLHRGDNDDAVGLNSRVELPVSNATLNVPVAQYWFSFGDDFGMGVFQSPPVLVFTVVPLLGKTKPHVNK